MPNKVSYEILEKKIIEMERLKVKVEIPTSISVKVLAFTNGAYVRLPKQWVGKRIKCVLEE